MSLLSSSDNDHRAAAATLSSLRGRELVTHNYVVVETIALVQARLGVPAVRRLVDGLLGVIDVEFADPTLHASAITALLAADKRAVSYVDRVSFELMRARGIETAFAFDDDFRRAGFELLGP